MKIDLREALEKAGFVGVTFWINSPSFFKKNSVTSTHSTITDLVGASIPSVILERQGQKSHFFSSPCLVTLSFYSNGQNKNPKGFYLYI